MAVKRQIIRCEVDLAKREITDVFTGSYAIIYAGSDLQFEFAFFRGGKLSEITPWDALKIDIVDGGNIVGARLVEKVIGKDPAPGAPAEERIDTSLTKATWEDETKQHALITLSDEESFMLNPVANEKERTLWIILRVTTSTGEVFTAIAAKALAIKDGHTGTGAPEPGDTAYYTKAEIDELFPKKSGLEVKFQAIPVWNPTQGRYQYIGLQGEAGKEEIVYLNEV